MPRVKKTTVREYIQTVGRRSSAVARVRLYPTKQTLVVEGGEIKRGDIMVNGMKMEEFFRFISYPPIVNKFLKKLGVEGKYIITVKTSGGGISGQLDAMIHGMARALDKHDVEKYHALLQEGNYLTRDARVRERRKVGNAGKARRKKSSPKR